MKPRLVIGLTGPAGSGKSEAAKVLTREFGFEVIDVDALGHTALENRKADLVGTFGNAILSETGAVNRKALGQLVFQDPTQLLLLNSIVHPEMVKTAREMLLQMPQKRVLIDAALLFNMGLNTLCGKVLAVTAPEAIRLERLLSKRGYDAARASGLIESQKTMDFSKADFTLQNNGGIAELETAVKTVVGHWLKEADPD